MPQNPPRWSHLLALAKDAFSVIQYLSAYFSNSAIYSISYWKPCLPKACDSKNHCVKARYFSKPVNRLLKISHLSSSSDHVWWPVIDHNYSYSQYWTGTSLQWRLMQGKLLKCKSFFYIFPCISLHCKQVDHEVKLEGMWSKCEQPFLWGFALHDISYIIGIRARA